ncbi:MAG: glutathione S-transferase N-terminal domain-containing protein [Cellvibrionaceae bacterium]|nr:glutathione S-transferase N-terminal domain-containing protein [Cellvibrionaceae bacterium]
MLKKILLKGAREGLGRIIVLLDLVTRPKKIQRSVEEQSKVDDETQRLSLYQFYACPFCVKTRRAVHRLNIPLAFRDAQKEPHREQLKSEAGKVKVPCLRIEEEGAVRWMYESNEIIRYLDQRFSP